MEPLRAFARLMDALRPWVTVRGVGAWFAALAILVHLSVPWTQLRAASADTDGLFPICSSHVGDEGGGNPRDDDAKKPAHCVLCLVYPAGKLVLPERATSSAIARTVSVAFVRVLGAHEPVVPRAVPPLPPRGPPSIA